MIPVRRILAPNPGPFTLEGTNTWLVGESPCVVIDPGPDVTEHVERVAAEAGRVAVILLTHRHDDHAPAAARLAALTGATIRAATPEAGERAIGHGEVVAGSGDVELEVVATPGHTPDHLAFLLRGGRALFTGDAVLGRGTSVIDPPEGDLAAYLGSLQAMLDLDPAVIHPGHGSTVTAAREKLQEYLDHRRMRERQVLAGLASGPRSPEELVAEIYADHPAELHPAAARSILAHLLKLEREGVVAVADPDAGRFDLTG
jgi:glyoxylase-like metal-dependent hydrolase (beta-lactamase superfamily II)